MARDHIYDLWHGRGGVGESWSGALPDHAGFSFEKERGPHVSCGLCALIVLSPYIHACMCDLNFSLPTHRLLHNSLSGNKRYGLAVTIVFVARRNKEVECCYLNIWDCVQQNHPSGIY